MPGVHQVASQEAAPAPHLEHQSSLGQDRLEEPQDARGTYIGMGTKAEMMSTSKVFAVVSHSIA